MLKGKGCPPLTFRLSCSGEYIVNVGQLDAGFVIVLLDDAPLATELGIDGLSFVTKLPQICMAALENSGPWFGVAGPKKADTSDPWVAMGTEYWYLYELRPWSLYASTIQYAGHTNVVSE